MAQTNAPRSHQRSLAGWSIGMTVYATLPSVGVVQGTLSQLREADDGSRDLRVPPGHVGVYVPKQGVYYVPWDDVRSAL